MSEEEYNKLQGLCFLCHCEIIRIMKEQDNYGKQ